MLENMKGEKNPLLLRNMLKNTFFNKFYQKVQKHLKIVPSLLSSKTTFLQKHAFQKIIRHVVLVANVVNIQTEMKGSCEDRKKVVLSKHDRSKSFTRMVGSGKEEK